jgi:serine/threonine-protein kinase
MLTGKIGDYLVLKRIALGGMAEIYSAKGPEGAVALKRLLPAHRNVSGYRQLFETEAALSHHVVNKNLVRTFRSFDHDGDLCLVQELVDGPDLMHLALDAHARGARLTPASALHAGLELLSALQALHGRGLVHRDVNPANLLVSPDGTVKLCDLGVAEPAGKPVALEKGALRGTPAYMSPEQVRAKPLDHRSDIFSAGIVLWELLANRPLFSSDSDFETLSRVKNMTAPPLRSVWPEAPTVLERLLVRALAKDARDRFQAAREMADALRAAAEREGLRGGQMELAAELARVRAAPAKG